MPDTNNDFIKTQHFEMLSVFLCVLHVVSNDHLQACLADATVCSPKSHTHVAPSRAHLY